MYDIDNNVYSYIQDSKKISRFVNESTLISNAANEMLNKAQGNISKARSQADSNVNRSRVVYDDSIGTREKAYKARSISAELKVTLLLMTFHILHTAVAHMSNNLMCMLSILVNWRPFNF